jgi:hypothetical protein
VQFDRKRVFSTPIPLLYPICVALHTVNMTMIGWVLIFGDSSNLWPKFTVK